MQSVSQGFPSERRVTVGVCWLLALYAAGSGAMAEAPDDSPVRQGEYVFRAAGCASCHTDEENDGEFLAGGRALKTPFGVFYTPNITPHPQYGIGRWSVADFTRAIKAGLSPRGGNYFPSFPYVAYSGMRREDVLALKAYLDTVAPVARRNRAHQLPWYLRLRSALWLWKWRYFVTDGSRIDAHTDPVLARGDYLVNALSHCGECHTPRDRFGGLIYELRHAGIRDGPEGGNVPNITPDRRTGIGKWSEDDLQYYLETGLAPDGDSAGSLMAEVIDNGTRHLSEQDRLAIARYILSLPPIENSVDAPTGAKKRELPDY